LAQGCILISVRAQFDLEEEPSPIHSLHMDQCNRKLMGPFLSIHQVVDEYEKTIENLGKELDRVRKWGAEQQQQTHVSEERAKELEEKLAKAEETAKELEEKLAQKDEAMAKLEEDLVEKLTQKDKALEGLELKMAAKECELAQTQAARRDLELKHSQMRTVAPLQINQTGSYVPPPQINLNTAAQPQYAMTTPSISSYPAGMAQSTPLQRAVSPPQYIQMPVSMPVQRMAGPPQAAWPSMAPPQESQLTRQPSYEPCKFLPSLAVSAPHLGG
jgi:uncharacterized coiled-coil protein SlyX